MDEMREGRWPSLLIWRQIAAATFAFVGTGLPDSPAAKRHAEGPSRTPVPTRMRSKRTVEDAGPYQDAKQEDRRGRRSLRKQTTGRFPAAAGGHAFSRGEGGFFIALIGGNEKDGCGMREITL